MNCKSPTVPLKEESGKEPRSKALIALAQELSRQGYAFVTPTPETHRRVLGRDPGHLARDLRDLFGWSKAFTAASVAEVPRISEILALLERADSVEPMGDRARSRVRFSTLEGQLFVHSAYPTEAADSVFFGPDTYRYVRFLRQADVRGGSVIDIGAGAGVGGLFVLRSAEVATLIDINPRALEYSAVNSAIAGFDPARVRYVLGQGLSELPHSAQGAADWVIANPPFLVDPKNRAYRNGGGPLGAGLSLLWAREACQKLGARGKFVLYTGSAIEGGRDGLKEALHALATETGRTLEYSELDPDIFGEELEHQAYWGTDRIAAVGAVLSRH